MPGESSRLNHLPEPTPSKFPLLSKTGAAKGVMSLQAFLITWRKHRMSGTKERACNSGRQHLVVILRLDRPRLRLFGPQGIHPLQMLWFYSVRRVT